MVRLLRRFGVSRTIVFSMATRGAQSLAALVTILLVGRYLDRTGQGYYYAFLGFVAFMQLAEFGLGYAVMQSASHERRDADTPGMALQSGQFVTPRLGELLRGAVRFNTASVILAALVLAVAGTVMLNIGEPLGSTQSVAWQAPWAAAILAAAASQIPNPRAALLEGIGFTEHVWLFRLVQELAAACALWISLGLGLALWSIAISYVARLAVAILWLGFGLPRAYFSKLTAQVLSGSTTYWRQEVWPFQWRIGVSALSGYLIYQFFTPLMFAVKGAQVAGQFGMTLALTNGLLTATSAWLTSQAPLFGRLIAQGSYDELDRRFWRALASSFAIAVAAGAALELTVVVLDRSQHPLSARLLPPGAFALFIAATLVNHVVFAMAVYLRAHRREPLMASSLLGALLTPITAYVTGSHFGIATVAASYFGLTLLGLGITTSLFLSRSRAWRVQALA